MSSAAFLCESYIPVSRLYSCLAFMSYRCKGSWDLYTSGLWFVEPEGQVHVCVGNPWEAGKERRGHG